MSVAIRDRVKELRRVKASELRANPKNWRTHPPSQRSALQSVLSEIGYAGACLAREHADGSLTLIDGHLRAEEAADDEVPVLVLDLSESEADKLLAVFDPLAAMAETDATKLTALLREIKTENASLQTLLDQLARSPVIEQAAPETIDEQFVALPKTTVTQPGDLWLLDQHRLLCGDCRNQNTIAQLCADVQIDLAVTSPPYAEQREYDPTSGFKPIPPSDYVEWWEPVQANIAARLAPGGSFFVNIKPAAAELVTELFVFDLVLAMARRWGWHFATEFCWERTGVPKRVTRRFKNQFEPIYQFVRDDWKNKMRPDAVRHYSDNVPQAMGPGVGDTSWKCRQGNGGVLPQQRKNGYTGNMARQQVAICRPGESPQLGDIVAPGLAYPGNRLPTFAGTHQATGHHAAFPVGLPAFFISAYTDTGDIVNDPFLGSGSTLVAAEQLSRRCYGTELSPSYCDVIVERWQNLTGGKAVRSG